MRELVLFAFILVFACGMVVAQGARVGIFEAHSEVGSVLHRGAVEYDGTKQVYTITSSGENIWASPDAFHFVWKKVSGDFALSADVALLGSGGNQHRKAVLMVRQSLDADSVYADVALHGDGLTSLQFRDDRGGMSQEVQAGVRSPHRVRLVKRGDYVYMLAAREGEPLQVAAGSPRIHLEGEYYIGIGVCAHDKDAVERAAFSHVELDDRNGAKRADPLLYSVLETVMPSGLNRQVAYVTSQHIEAPNWTRENQFIFNGGGRIYRLPVGSTAPVLIDTGLAKDCNNDHGISPDGKTLVVSDSAEERKSVVYTVPITGGTAKRITKNAPSYWHGWSPDGKTLAFVGERNGDFDIYTISTEGGEETRMTTAKGLDDGPEYTPDGRYIYINSERTGHMQIWRMKADGSEQEQVTHGEQNDWFPHFSPDGQKMAFLSFEKDVTGHPPNKDVMLRLMSMPDGKISVVAKMFGGQGTMNVPSWSADGTRFAFVSYIFVDPVDVVAK